MTHITFSRPANGKANHPIFTPVRAQTKGAPRAVAFITAGLLIGVLTSFGQTYLATPWAALANSVSAWLLAPFVVGAFSRSARPAALLGAATCLAQLIGYDVTSVLRGFAAGVEINVFWALCAVVGGPAFGAAGWAWRHASGWLRELGAAALPGAFLGEGLVSYYLTLHADSTAGLWVAIAVLLIMLLNHDGARELRWLAGTFATACLCELLLPAIYTSAL
jgi:hypothetical protein